MRRLPFIAFGILFPVLASGQPSLSVRSLAVAEGLSQSSAQVLHQDRLGIVWIGTQDGLNHFDGHEITVLKPSPLDPGSLSGSSIIALAEDSEGNLWIGTEYGGLNRLNRASGRIDHYYHDPEDAASVSSDEISALALDSDGTLWIGTSIAGLNRLNIATGLNERVFVEPGTVGPQEDAWILDLETQPDGGVLIALESGLQRFDRDTGIFTQVWPAQGDTLTIPVVIDVETDPAGGIWLGTAEGLIHLDPASESERRLVTQDPLLVITVMSASDGTVWAGTADAGLYVAAPGSDDLVRVDETIALGDDTVYSMMEDASGLVWAGTESAGAKVLTPRIRRFQAMGENLDNPEAWSILERRNGEIWVGTADGGVDVMGADGTRLRRYRSRGYDVPLEGTIPPGIVLGLFEDDAGSVWVGMDGEGAARWDPDTDAFEWLSPWGESDFRAAGVLSFAQTADGLLWMGTGGWGLVSHDRGAGTFHDILIHPDSSDGANVVNSIHPTEEGYLWVGTEDGLAGVDPATEIVRLIRPDPERPDGLSSGLVFHVTVSPAGELWASTQVGLNRYIGDPQDGGEARFERFFESTGLPNDVIYAALADEQGTMWLSTNRGLGALVPATGDVRVFGQADGLPGLEYNHGAAVRGPSGDVFFGGIEGVTRVLEDSRTFREYEAPVLVTAVSVFNDEVASDLSDGGSVRLRHDENYVTFAYASLDYLRPGAARFAYRLDPDDGEWTQAGTRRYQSYNNLAPGSYTFRVRGTNGDGVWSPRETAVHLEIVPPFWSRWWFRLLGLAVFLGVTALGVRTWRQQDLRARDTRIMTQRRINDRLEAERLHLAREIHDGPIQHLQLTGFRLKSLEEQLKTAAGPAADTPAASTNGNDELEGVRMAIGEAMTELRAICGSLRPPALVHFGLASAIRSHADRQLESLDDLEIELDLPTDGAMLSPRLRLGFFRMYQEAMSNVIRHARPCRVRVSLRVDERNTELVVADDGPGFPVPADWSSMAADAHFGLLGAQERVAALGGEMQVSSAPMSGTTIRFRAPSAFAQEEIT